MFVFFPDSFLVSPEGPQIPKKLLAAPKSTTTEGLNFFRNVFLFSGFNVIFLKLQNGYISANKLNFEKLSPLSFLKLLKLEKIKCLYFFHFEAIQRSYGHIMDYL